MHLRVPIVVASRVGIAVAQLDGSIGKRIMVALEPECEPKRLSVRNEVNMKAWENFRVVGCIHAQEPTTWV
jgi:hypothetical protein